MKAIAYSLPSGLESQEFAQATHQKQLQCVGPFESVETAEDRFITWTYSGSGKRVDSSDL